MLLSGVLAFVRVGSAKDSLSTLTFDRCEGTDNTDDRLVQEGE